jgi:alkanesulfonate monooxygenase SsuD/methylene tetrahydromethanopterin reductase-like flavin-dependent oxidoreductase (luciferase family)
VELRLPDAAQLADRNCFDAIWFADALPPATVVPAVVAASVRACVPAAGCCRERSPAA